MAVLAKIYLVRHGETDANRERIIQGQLDTPLNGIGLDQSKSVARALKDITFDLVLSSDLSRASATATAILKHQRDLNLHQDAELRERFMGELQGQAVYGSAKLPMGESTIETNHAFSTRALTWWKKAIVDYTASLPLREEPYRILAVSHGGFISTLVRNLIHGGQLISEKVVILPSLRNVSVTTIEWDGKVWRLVKYGDASHLSTGPLEHNVDEIRI
ncbi:hypothetical protein AN958_08709 [Leucoagaricus sp. SymC.cos]|nr:hypothetical protein AN958_08709 [Leucoagaricus sp. SymC.cos]